MKEERTICEQLFAYQDEKYRSFMIPLIPGIDEKRVIGVRMPDLRKVAKNISETKEMRVFLESLPHIYQEENNLHGILISQEKDYKACVGELNQFLPFVDNWATCDLIRPKVVKKHLSQFLSEIFRWMESDHVYTIRFGIEMLMTYYLDDEFQADYHERVCSIQSEEYYVNMMRAWYFATALGKQYEKTLPFLEEQRLDLWTHNKTIQKAVESLCITAEKKTYLRTLKS